MCGYGELFSFWTADSWTVAVEMCPSITSQEGCSYCCAQLPVGSGVVGGIVGDHGADGDGVDGVRLLLEHTAAQRGQHPQQVLHAAPGSVDIIYIYVDCRYIYIQ